MVGVGLDHFIGDDLHVAGQHDERHVLFFQQFHFSSLHLGLVGMVLVDAPYMVGDTELEGNIAQILMIADDAWDVNIDLTGFPPCQQVIEAMAHFRDEDSHAGLHVVEVEVEGDAIALWV